jgi:RNA polymerase sigma-70 factor (ECF subfamily)
VTDADLARRAASGDQEAFGRLVERHMPVARRVAAAVVGADDEADDAVQDGFLSAWRAIDRFDPARPFRPWLLRIVVNAARDAARRARVRRTEPLHPEFAGGAAGPDRATDRALLREALRDAMATLPDRQRVAVTLFDAEGFSHAEIAESLGIPEGTVRSDVFHGRRALRARLKPFLEEA